MTLGIDGFERGMGLRLLLAAGACALALALAPPAFATDGGSAAPEPACGDTIDNDADGLVDGDDPDCTDPYDPSEWPDGEAALLLAPQGGGPAATYYQATVGDALASLSSADPTLPSVLHVVPAAARAVYAPGAATPGRQEWELRIEGFERNHERVDAIYDMVLVLPLPAAADGRDAFQALDRGVRIEEGLPGRSVPLVYGGEKVVLKRNVGLEKGLLPQLLGEGDGRLPSLAGTGYRWTVWDTIVERDAGFGDVVQARAVLRYATAPDVAPPPAHDERLAAYLITWIPQLSASVPPYAVRMDVVEARP